MRPAQDLPDGRSSTPIYDALYSEYRRSFKALPGDRHGEEDLGFAAFGTSGYGSHRSSYYDPPGSSRPEESDSGGPHSGWQSSWQSSLRRHGTGSSRPAALPPAPPRWERQ